MGSIIGLISWSMLSHQRGCYIWGMVVLTCTCLTSVGWQRARRVISGVDMHLSHLSALSQQVS
jgi:hypothetical protein